MNTVSMFVARTCSSFTSPACFRENLLTRASVCSMTKSPVSRFSSEFLIKTQSPTLGSSAFENVVKRVLPGSTPTSAPLAPSS